MFRRTLTDSGLVEKGGMKMWTDEAVNAGVAAARSMVSADGADLILVKADARRARIDLKLDVTNLSCDDGSCLVQGPLLHNIIVSKLQEHLDGEFEVRIDDPRLSQS